MQLTLPSDTEILLTREFDAPPHLVYEASTKPEHVRRWWCCMEGFTMPICEIDLRVGGAWRYVMLDPEGREVGFHGEYKEIVPNERIVHTEIFDPFPQAPTLVTVTFEARGGKTLLRSLQQCASKEARDAIIESGMEHGAAIAWDRLEAVAGELASGAARTPAPAVGG